MFHSNCVPVYQVCNTNFPNLFQKPQMRPMIAEYDPKKKGVRNDLSDVVMVK